jgi:DNA-directed RNA polymerase specialized sigma24 family protein
LLNKIEINKLYLYALVLTNQDEEAYDLVHSAILKIEGRSMLKELAYAKTVVRHLFFDNKKKEKRLDSLSSDSLVLDHSFEDMIINQDEIEELLKKLQPVERELLFLIAVEGHSYKEVAAISGEKINTLLTRFKRIKEKVSKRNLN